MIQLLKLRSFMKDGKEKKFDAFIGEGIEADSLQELFSNLAKYIDKIPADERWNCFYTLANCTPKKRDFQSQSILPFDIDGIDQTKVTEYIEVTCATLGVRREEIGIVSSGNGLHFLIGLLTPIVDKKFFDQTRDHYKALLDSLAKAYLSRGLQFDKVDPSIYDARRIFRLPGTVNRKPNKADRVATIINGTIKPIAFDITLASGIPTVHKDEQLSKEFMRKFPKVDNAAIFEGCGFIKGARENPSELDEPALYAALSIVGRMENGDKVAEEIFSPRFGVRTHGGTLEDLQMKLEQSMNASGPRTCKSISRLSPACQGCPHFKAESSPITLRSADKIQTEDTGFHDLILNPTTGKMSAKPNFEDLRRYFEREHTYRSHDKLVWIYNGTHYSEMSNEEVMNFAQTNFDPYANAKMRHEFLELVQVTNLVDQETWGRDTFGKINMQNGILDLQSMELMPHSSNYGFKYVLPYAYDPKSKAPRFEKFLDEVCEKKQTLKDTLLEFGGYALAGAHCIFQKALVLEGEGSNGKSTFIDTLKAVAGEKSFSTLAFKDLDHTERRSGLDGKLFNITEETPNKLFDTTSFKNLISGGHIPMRKLYKNAYEMRNKTKLIFSCNEMPSTSDTSKGFFRRFLIIPFRASFSRVAKNVDVNIQDKLNQELPGILNLFLSGYQRLIKQNDFSKIEENDDDIREYREATDPVVLWYREEVKDLGDDALSRDHYVTCQDLFQSFKNWCEKNGFESRTKNSAVLSKALQRILPTMEHRRVLKKLEGVPVRVIKGISLHSITPQAY